MPVQTVILPEIDLAFTRWYGEIDLDQMLSSQRAYTAMPLYHVQRTHLFDVSDVTEAKIDFDGFTEFVELVNSQSFTSEPKQVVTIAPTDVLYGRARQYQSLIEAAGHIRVQICRDERSALQFLGRPETTLSEMLNTCPSWPGADDLDGRSTNKS